MLAATHDDARGEQCLAAPKQLTPAGQHWRFHLDRHNNRKCWYLRDEASGAATTPAADPADKDDQPESETIPKSAADARAELPPDPPAASPRAAATAALPKPDTAANVLVAPHPENIFAAARAPDAARFTPVANGEFRVAANDAADPPQAAPAPSAAPPAAVTTGQAADRAPGNDAGNPWLTRIALGLIALGGTIVVICLIFGAVQGGRGDVLSRR
jgi:hypothetical protein